MRKTGVMALLAAGLLLGWPGAGRPQTVDVDALLESYGFEIKRDNGTRYVEVSLEELLRLVLERNTGLESVRVDETIAQSRLNAARERFNPTLSNRVEYGRVLAPSLFFSQQDNFLTLNGTDTVTLSSEYSQPLRNGMEYALTYTEERTRPVSTDIPQEGEPGDMTSGEWLESTAVTGSVRIPIAQDAGHEFNAIPERRSRVDLTRSRLGIRQRELELLERSARTYWDLVGALENVQVQREAVELSEQLLADNRERLEAGVLSPFDVQVTEAQLARDREALLNARTTVARIEDEARALLNLEVIDFQIRPVDQPTLRDVPSPYRELLEQVYRNNPEVGEVEQRLARNRLDLEEARNRDKADLDLELFYTLKGYSDDPLRGAQDFSEPDTDEYGALFTWTVPLFDVETREAIRRRQLERQQLELRLSSVKSDLNVRVQGVLRQIRLSREEVQTARVATRLAEEQLQNEIERFQVGESTSFQVSQVQQEVSQARVQEILARVRFERNLLQLQVLSGRIYSSYGLESPYAPEPQP